MSAPRAVRPGRPGAAAAIWDWRRANDDAAADRAERLRARVGGAVGVAIALVAAAFGQPSVAAIAGTIGGLVLAASWAAPIGWLRMLRAAFERLGVAAARVVGAVLLAPLYWLVLTPFGLLTRRGARDPLKRRLEPGATTYWTRRERASNPERPF